MEEKEGSLREIKDLIPDSQFGIRWKNGAFDRRMRGDVLLRNEKVVITPRSVSELNTFIVDFLSKYESVCDLAIENSMLFEGINDPDTLLCTREKVFSTIFDMDIEDVDEENLNFTIRRLRMAFIKYNSVMLNCLSSAAVYAEFSGMKESTVRSHIERGKFDIVSICGTRFILIPEEKIIEYNEFIMRRWLNVAKYDPLQAEKDSKMIMVYSALYDRTISQVRTIESWVESEGMLLSGDTKVKTYTENAWKLYCFWCKNEGYAPEPLKTFAMQIYSMGFVKFNRNKRGFYYWRNKT